MGYDLGDIATIKNNILYKDKEFFIKRKFKEKYFNQIYYGISLINTATNRPLEREFKCKEEFLEIVSKAKTERFLIFTCINPYDTYELEFKDISGNIRDKIVGNIDNFAPGNQVVIKTDNGLYINEVKNIIYMKNVSMRDFKKLKEIKQEQMINEKSISEIYAKTGKKPVIYGTSEAIEKLKLDLK